MKMKTRTQFAHRIELLGGPPADARGADYRLSRKNVAFLPPDRANNTPI
jgi:hypothetical protein